MKWKAIKGYEGLYEISDTGFVKSLPRQGTWTREPRIMVGSIDNHGYSQVVLSKKGKGRTVKIHKLVAKAFLPNPNHLREINHIDENKQNNNVLNLEWCTRKYNVNYGKRTEKTRKPVIQMALDGTVIKEHIGVKAAAAYMGKKHASAISHACSRRGLTAYGYKWEYKENHNGQEKIHSF